MNHMTGTARLSVIAAALALVTGTAVSGPTWARDGADDDPAAVATDDSTPGVPDDSPGDDDSDDSRDDDSDDSRDDDSDDSRDDDSDDSRDDDSDSRSDDSRDDDSDDSRDDDSDDSRDHDRGREVREGTCETDSDWKLKAKTRDGRIEVELEIDSDDRGERWKYVFKHNGEKVVAGKRTTRGASGFFTVRQRLDDTKGTDVIRSRARSIASGETCSAKVKI